MSQRILANLGFLLQIAGLLTLFPIGIGFYFNETQQLIPLFMTCIAFLGCGFLFIPVLVAISHYTRIAFNSFSFDFSSQSLFS